MLEFFHTSYATVRQLATIKYQQRARGPVLTYSNRIYNLHLKLNKFISFNLAFPNPLSLQETTLRDERCITVVYY